MFVIHIIKQYTIKNRNDIIRLLDEMEVESVKHCMVCERIDWIKNGKNPYFVKELNTGYVVIGDHQRIKGYSLFLCKEHATELHFL